jgi:hypothetical protein
VRYFSRRKTHWPSRGLSKSKQVDNLSGHNSRHLKKTTEESTPENKSHVAMKE